MTYQEECLVKFNQLPPDFRGKVKNPSSDQTLKGLEEKYGVKLDFLIILAMIGELAIDDIPEYLVKRYDLSDEKALAVKDELVKKIFSGLLPAENTKIFSPEEKIKSIFENNLVAFFQGDETIKKEINLDLVYLFSINENFPEELSKIILNNQEKLPTQPLKINNRLVEPTISNWLKDFFEKKSSENVNDFDDVVVSQYVIASPSTKGLEENEKKVINDLLKLYRNIKFYPFYQKGEARDWEIFPLVKEEGKREKLTAPAELKPEAPKADLKTIKTPAENKFLPGQLKNLQKESQKIITDTQTKIQAAIKKNAGLMNNIKVQEQEIIKEYRQNVEKLKGEFHLFLKNKNPEKTAAALFILARLRKIDHLMSEMTVKKIFMEEIIPLLSRQIGSISEPALMDKFKQDPNNPVYVKIFLKYILSKAFEGREEEGAFVATQLENILSVLENTEYLGLAFYNLKTEKYEWAEVKISESGDLIIE